MIEYVLGYHGTDRQSGLKLEQGNVDITFGGGELGQGFYLSQWHYVARQWAHHRCKSSAVVQFQVPERTFWNQNLLPLSKWQADHFRQQVRRALATRTYRFEVDIVWAPIVGTLSIYSDQYKYESEQSQALLNSPEVIRTIR